MINECREAIGSHATTLSFNKRGNRKSENLVRLGMPSFLLPKREESILIGKGILKKKYVCNIHYKFRNSIHDINCFIDNFCQHFRITSSQYTIHIYITYIFTQTLTHMDTYIHTYACIYANFQKTGWVGKAFQYILWN